MPPFLLRSSQRIDPFSWAYWRHTIILYLSWALIVVVAEWVVVGFLLLTGLAS